MGLSESLNRLGFTNKVGKYLKFFKIKKTISIFSVVFLLSLTFLFSCDRNDENNEKQLQINNISTLKATAKTSSKSIFNKTTAKIAENSATLIFDYNQEEIAIDAGVTNTGNYIFDMDADGTIDLQIEPITSDYSQIYYLDENGNRISKAHVDIQETTAIITILEVYTSPSVSGKYGALAKKGKWRQCFEGVAGSAEGIAGAVLCNFGGPWCLAGYYSGIALGCLGA